MKISLVHMVAVVALLLTSCSKEQVLNPLENGPMAMTFTADIKDPMGTATRATGTSFELNDSIGVFIVDDMPGRAPDPTCLNLKYVYDGEKFTSDTPYYFQNLDPVTFKVYYPYRPTSELIEDLTFFLFNTEAAHQTPEGRAKNDILYSQITTTARTPQVALTGENAFKHTMAKMTLIFKAGSGIPDLSLLSSYTLKNLDLYSAFAIRFGFVHNYTSENSDLTISVAGTNTPTLTAPLMLIPQPLKEKDTSGSGRLPIEVTYDNQVYKTKLKFPRDWIERGHHYIYTITVNKTGLSISSVLDDWVSQGTTAVTVTL